MSPIVLSDGQIISEVPIRENQTCLLGIAAVNRSTAIWGPDAHIWRPTRWLDPLPPSVIDAKVPGVYSHLYICFLSFSFLLQIDYFSRLTFAGGGRACMFVSPIF
jgi:cytochrome P450